MIDIVTVHFKELLRNNFYQFLIKHYTDRETQRMPQLIYKTFPYKGFK